MHCIEQDSLAQRRSIYNLSDTAIVSDNCFLETVKSCLLHCPTPFNVQSSRLVILFNKQHHLFWDLVWKNMQTIIPDSRTAASKEKINSFKKAYGTILFFEDKKSLAKLKKQFPLYKKNMDIWAQQANGMLQYMIWQALSENGIGASLQHYNELVLKEIHQLFNLPKNWQLIAQMPWGSIAKEPGDKSFLPLENRLIVLK